MGADPSGGESVAVRGGVMRIPPGTTVVPHRVLVRYRADAGLATRMADRVEVNAARARAYSLVPRLALLHLPPGQSVTGAVAALSRDPSVEYAVPDLAVKEAATPDDPLAASQWALQAIGAPTAWDRTTGSANVTVAVLDSGVDPDHPDLAANLVPGWNLLDDTSDASDDYGHGTHVAGIIGAVGDNGTGVTGIDWRVSLMPLKICDAGGSCDLDAEVSALQYAVAHGATIANASFGGYYGGYQPEEDAIAAAGRAGLLYVAAAGNAGSDNDVTPFYPAGYPLDNIISVAATTSAQELASFSNYGFGSVQTAAPGQDVLSTMLTSGPLSDPSGYGTLSGTSMAAPEVAGAAALLWAEHPDWTMQQVRMRLLTTASPLASLTGQVADCGQLDVAAATDPTLPDEGIVCVRLRGTGGGSVSSVPAGIDCGAACVASVPAGTTVTLSATPAPGSTFAGWSGACSGSDTCSVSASGIADVTATFRTPGSTPGWVQQPLPAPAGRDPFAPGSALESSPGDFSTFYNVAVSADGTERAETIFNPPSTYCGYASSDTGGVFLERRTADGWVSDGEVTAPSVPAYAGDPLARWANCSNFGTVTQLSADGTTLLVAPSTARVWGGGYRCAAYVYERGSSGWALGASLYPPDVAARGSTTWDGCGYFGIGGALSGDGNRIAMPAAGLSGSGGVVLRADVYVRAQGSWSLEQQVTLPSPTVDCAHTIGPRYLSLSGDGATMLVGSPDCDRAGLPGAGLVYAYQRSGSQWTLAQTFRSPEPAENEGFGRETALSADGSTAVIGSRDADGVSTWVFERGQGGWQMSAVLADPESGSPRGFSCPAVVEDGARIVCGAFDNVGLNPAQGAVYIYDRPAGGWDSAQPQAREEFADDGNAFDLLGLGNPCGWITVAAPEDGSFLDVPMSPTGLASGAHPHDRIGYEFATDPTAKTLTVAFAGSGTGSVASDPSGIECGAICSDAVSGNAAETLALTATPAPGSRFSGWSGACSGTGTCEVPMTGTQSVTATFSLVPETLTAAAAGNGAGRVSSTPAGISCGGTCSSAFTYGTNATLTAIPAVGSRFTGWSGACTGAGGCSVAMNQTRFVTAIFSLVPEVLTVKKSGSGSGRVASSAAGISCGTACMSSFGYGTKVTLTATAAPGSKFSRWTGACAGASACTVTMNQARRVTAAFALKPRAARR